MAVYDDIRICNMALDRIGCNQPISALTDVSAAAATCKRWFEVCRDATLEDYAWPFANKTKALAVVEDNPDETWGYSYRYPSDCVRALGFDVGSTDPNHQPEFEVGGDDSGKLILTNESNASLRYTRRVDVAALYSATFASAVAWRMAMEMAPALSRKDGARMEAMQAYYAAISQAEASQSAERRPPQPPDGGSVRARS